MKNIEDYKGNNNYVIACRTQEEWDYITKLLKCNWYEAQWNTYKENSYICVNYKDYGSLTYINSNYTILEAKDFMEEIKYTLEYCKANKIAVEVPSVEIGEQIAKLVPGKHEKNWYKHINYPNKMNFRFDYNEYDLYINGKDCLTRQDYKFISAEQFIKDNTQQMEKPKYFVIKENDSPLWWKYIKWLGDTYLGGNDAGGYNKGWYYGFDGRNVATLMRFNELKLFQNNPKVLTLEQWKSIFIENNQTMQKLTVKKSEFKKVYNVACSTWQTKCKEYASKDPFSDVIEFTEAQIEEMFNAAQSHQLPVLEEVFGKRNTLFNSNDLKVGEIMLVTEGQEKGRHLSKNFNGYFTLEDMSRTWSINHRLDFRGKKLPKGTKIEIIAG